MAESILTVFRRNALKFGNKPCFHFKSGGRWQQVSWVDAEEQVRRYALGLAGMGIKLGDKVALLSKTRLEWTLLDLAILANQAITVPVYATLAADQIAYIINDSDTRLLIVENVTKWNRVAPHLKNFSGAVILMDGSQEGLLPLEHLPQKGKGLPVNLYDENLKQIQPSHTATIVYTSGTTGPPKGAIITHRNILAEMNALQAVFKFGFDDVGLMCLPLAHVIARAMQFYQLAQGCQSAYAESLDMLSVDMREIRPSFMAGVPRLFEKMHETILTKTNRVSPMLQKLFSWSLDVGLRATELSQKKMPVGFGLRLAQSVGNLFVYRKIRKAFGGKIQCFISGGAPLQKEIAQFLNAVGILVIEGYGLTETFAAITLNRLDDFRFGTVGKPLEGVRIKMAPDGEICAKGDTIFSGYWHLKEETEAAFDKEGWFLTGDIGEFTKDGFLRITDRKRDIIKTSGGKMVAPQNIENLMQQSRYIQQFMVYGEGKKFLSGLVTLNWHAVEDFAREEAIDYQNHDDLAQNPQIVALIQKEIDQMNGHLSHFETIRKFVILSRNFSIETGELTPTLKIKRRQVCEKYKNVLDGLYKEHSL